MGGPPKPISMTEGWEYLQKAHKVKVARQTFYNWAKAGRLGVVLRTQKTKLGTRYTTTGWVDDFISALGQL